jgi:hypothetical protein
MFVLETFELMGKSIALSALDYSGKGDWCKRLSRSSYRNLEGVRTSVKNKIM